MLRLVAGGAYNQNNIQVRAIKLILATRTNDLVILLMLLVPAVVARVSVLYNPPLHRFEHINVKFPNSFWTESLNFFHDPFRGSS